MNEIDVRMMAIAIVAVALVGFVGYLLRHRGRFHPSQTERKNGIS